MAGGRSTINTVLKCGTTAGSLTKLCRIKSYPQLGGAPEQLETTDLEDTMDTFVLGVQKVEPMEFGANYEKEVYDDVKDKERTDLFYQLEFGEDGVDGIFSWKGQHSVYVNEGELNGVRCMTISISPSTEIMPVAATELTS